MHHIALVGDRTLLALDRNKLLLPPLYTRYFMWGFPDRSARVSSVEADKVRGETERRRVREGGEGERGRGVGAMMKGKIASLCAVRFTCVCLDKKQEKGMDSEAFNVCVGDAFSTVWADNTPLLELLWNSA